jgi:hypothetical protein
VRGQSRAIYISLSLPTHLVVVASIEEDMSDPPCLVCVGDRPGA